MSREFGPYPAYKDSGVEWIGEMPEKWDVVSFTKSLDSIVDYRGKTPKKVEEGIFLVTAKNVKNGTINYKISREFVEPLNYEEIMRRGKPRLGDVLFTTEAPLGEVANVDTEDIALAQRIIKIRGKQSILDNYYLKYWIMSQGFQDNLQTFATGSTAQGIKSSKLGQLLVMLPSYIEQVKISDYLNQKTSEIDALIADKEKLISLLEEKRQAVITETVTKGLDPNAKMKDSGIEWIGEIPEHWEGVKLKYIGKPTMGLLYSPNDLCGEGEGFLVLRASNIQKGNIDIDREDNVYVNKEINKNQLTLKDDLLICARSGSRELIGKSAMIDEKSAGNSFGVFTTIYRSIYNPYIKYVFQSGLFQSQIGTYLTSTINQLTMQNLNNLEVVLPPVEEQSSIQEKLDSYTESHEQAVKEIKNQISKLKEYRESLIYEAVTGKIDLRNYGEVAELLVAERGEAYGD